MITSASREDARRDVFFKTALAKDIVRRRGTTGNNTPQAQHCGSGAHLEVPSQAVPDCTLEHH
eukprot:6483320-Amphidinium_carterae.2